MAERASSRPAGALVSPLKQTAIWYLPAAMAGALAQALAAWGGSSALQKGMALLGAASMFGAGGILALVLVRYGRDASAEARRRANHLRLLGLGSLVGGYLLSPAGVQSAGPDAGVAGALVLAGALAWVLWLEREWRGARGAGARR